MSTSGFTCTLYRSVKFVSMPGCHCLCLSVTDPPEKLFTAPVFCLSWTRRSVWTPRGFYFAFSSIQIPRTQSAFIPHALFWVNTLSSCSTWLYDFIIIPEDFAVTKTQKVVHVQWNKGGTVSFLPRCLVFYFGKQTPIQKQSKGFINFIYLFLFILCSSLHWINNLLTFLIEKYFTCASSSQRSKRFLTWFIYCYDYLFIDMVLIDSISSYQFII